MAAVADEVWEAWTTRDGIVSFFAPDAEIEPRVGGAFQVYMDPLRRPGMKGADDMRYLALQPQADDHFDWNAPPHLAEARQQRTFVVVRSEPLGDKLTRVTLHHTGWGEAASGTRPTPTSTAPGRRARQLEEALRQRAADWSGVARATAQDARHAVPRAPRPQGRRTEVSRRS